MVHVGLQSQWIRITHSTLLNISSTFQCSDTFPVAAELECVSKDVLAHCAAEGSRTRMCMSNINGFGNG